MAVGEVLFLPCHSIWRYYAAVLPQPQPSQCTQLISQELGSVQKKKMSHTNTRTDTKRLLAYKGGLVKPKMQGQHHHRSDCPQEMQ